jgi:saccharopine dehydrogenase-like NADP-dependent oxidoreductase
MSNILVLGAGQMGVPIAYALNYLNHKVIIADNNDNNIGKSKTFLGCSGNLPSGYVSTNGIYVKRFDVRTQNIQQLFTDTKPEIVISSLPYTLNSFIAKNCVVAGIAYCDLGGHVPTTEAVAQLAKTHATAPVATDQGLAPGLVNIVAEMGCDVLKHEPQHVLMCVGGLPEFDGINVLGYIPTWSVEGLINEYSGEGWAISDGKKTKVKALQGLESALVNGENLEAFCTSGGSAHSIESMQKRGVQNCYYKTLRYPGHCKLVNFFINELKFSKELLFDIFDSLNVEYEVLDVVHLYVGIWCNNHTFFSFERAISSGKQFSAMQRGTGYSAAATAHLMTKIDWKTNVLSYRDINHKIFHDTFDELLKHDSCNEEEQWTQIPSQT